MSNQSKRIAKRFVEEVWNEADQHAANELCTEDWGNWDQLGLMQQLGVIPKPER